MSGKLTDKDMDQLEHWIGKGNKTFTLLYAITRDGCNTTTFHQKCNNQGPTVTVLYNQQGSVYGGYTSISWRGSGTYGNDASAFLFQLQYNNKKICTKFPIKTNQTCAIYDSGHGPTFGGGQSGYYDLYTFSGTIKQTGGYFPLNGSMNIGQDYDNQSLNTNQINNGSMYVTELEVYKVTEHVVAFKPLADLKVKDARILMVGPVGAGKSSFYNTINSIFRGRVTQKASSGSAEQSLTTAYTIYQVKTHSGAALNFRLCDTRGLEEHQGLDVIECNYLLDGNIPNHYQFNPAKPITPKTPGFKTAPTADDMIQCGVFVLDATTLAVLSTKIVEKLKAIRNLMNEKGVPQVILLTKIDKLCTEVAENTSCVYKSTAVFENVDKAAQLLGLPRANVLPVKNYENELEMDEDINILALLSLREILHHAEDCMENALDKILEDEEGKEGVESLKEK